MTTTYAQELAEYRAAVNEQVAASRALREELQREIGLIEAAQPRGETIELRENCGQFLGPLPDNRVVLREALGQVERPHHPNEDVDAVIDLLEAVWRRHLPGEPLSLRVDPVSDGAVGHSFWSPRAGAYVVRLEPGSKIRENLMVGLHELGHVVRGHLPRHDHDMRWAEQASSVMAVHRDRKESFARLSPEALAAHRAETKQHEDEADAWAEREYRRLFERAA